MQIILTCCTVSFSRLAAHKVRPEQAQAEASVSEKGELTCLPEILFKPMNHQHSLSTFLPPAYYLISFNAVASAAPNDSFENENMKRSNFE